ncbi:unannotated protein [freshwater metagenome]|uniref:Unannotated protein n=1 Tax=freshwater metagenome TaxID=449393 RepID=A0A6J7BYS2_9ZZZZ
MSAASVKVSSSAAFMAPASTESVLTTAEVSSVALMAKSRDRGTSPYA